MKVLYIREIRRAVMCGVLLACLGVPARAKSRPTLKHASAAVDSDYVSALTTANRFLQAWQSHDQETGLLLLSDAAKQKTSAESLDNFFSSSRGAYEIARGKKARGNRYCFSIVLFDVQGGSHAHHAYSELVVRRAGKSDWEIDRLPRP